MDGEQVTVQHLTAQLEWAHSHLHEVELNLQQAKNSYEQRQRDLLAYLVPLAKIVKGDQDVQGQGQERLRPEDIDMLDPASKAHRESLLKILGVIRSVDKVLTQWHQLLRYGKLQANVGG